MAKKRNKNHGNNINQMQGAKQVSQPNILSRLKKGINAVIPDGEDIPEITSDVVVLEKDADYKNKAETALIEIEQLLQTIKNKISVHEEAKVNYDKLSIAAEKNEKELNEAKNKVDKELEVIYSQKNILEKSQKKIDVKEKEQLDLEGNLEAERRQAISGFIQDKRAYIEDGRNEVDNLQKESLDQLSNQFEDIKQQKNELLKLEINIREREANAESEFIDNQEAILSEFKDEKGGLELELSDLRKLIVDETESQKQNLESISDEQHAQLNEQRVKLIEIEEKLKNNQRQIDSDTLILQARQRSQTEFEAEVEKKVEHRYSMGITDLNSQLEEERISREQDQTKLASLYKQLHQFKDLERTLEDQDIESVQEELSTSRSEIKKLKSKLLSSGREGLEENNEILEEQVEEQEEKIIDLTRELAVAKTELSTTRLSVLDKHHLEREKRVLEDHNRLLKVATDDLRIQLDELVDKQQGSKTFPALSQLDQDHRNEAANLQDVPMLFDFAEQIRLGLVCVDRENPLYFKEEDIRLFIAGLSMSSLHILHGMSGTGKTSLATSFASVVGGDCTLIPVQAGWRDKDDLIGHYNAFEKKFYEKEALQAIYRAQLPAYRDRINFIVLDEINLSRPEQYFSEFLSAMEIKESKRNIVLVEEKQSNAPELLIDGRKIKVPDNVWFIGTANHDETTNEFADKTYDRAHVMELQRSDSEINTDNYDAGMTYSYPSLLKMFTNATNKHEHKLTDLLQALNESVLSMVLEENFDVSWGNRLDQHAKRFIPVMIESGGSLEDGLDHLLSTKVLRRGKVTGRFDINVSDLDALEDGLITTWKDLKLKGKPVNSLELIAKDKKRMERNS